MKTSKNSLISLVNLLRGYGNRLLADLTTDELQWVPLQTRGRSIMSYFRHIINSEIFWLIHLGEKDLQYYGPKNTIEELLEGFDKIKEFLVKKVNNSSEDQMELIIPERKGEEVIRQGTLGWMIWRTSMHAVHHFAQVAYIRFALEHPPKEDSQFHWSAVMDQILMLKN
jgi:hypothetical protein